MHKVVAAAPVGWLAHPNAPGYFYNPQNPADIVLVQAPTPASMGNLPMAPVVPSYGEIDPNVARHEVQKATRSSRRDDDVIYLDFPELPREPGSEVKMLVRLLPPWSPVEKAAWVIGGRHRLYADMDPRWQPNWKSQFFFPECYGVHRDRGLGDCDICAAVNECATSDNKEANDFASNAQVQERHYWQGLHLDEPTKHFRQYTRDGQPVFDPQTNQVLWIVQPGILSLAATLGRKLLHFAGETSTFTHPDRGINVRLIKRRSTRGVYPMNVEYDAVTDMRGPSPLDAQFRSVLGNLYDLREQCIRLRSREEMAKIAQNIRARFGLIKSYSMPLPDVGRWAPHPNNPAYEVNPATGQVRPASPPAVPPALPVPVAPAVPPPLPPMAAAPMPSSFGPVPAPVAPAPPILPAPVPGYVPAPVAPPLPPPVAPGLVGAVPAPGLPSLPELPPLPPVADLAVPPPPPAGAPGAPMTPEQIEAALKATGADVPF